MAGDCLVGGSASPIQPARWCNGSSFNGYVLDHSDFMRTLFGRTNRTSRSAISGDTCCHHLRGDGECMLHGRMGHRTHCRQGMAKRRKVFWDNLFYPWVGFFYVINSTAWSFNRFRRSCSVANVCCWKIIIRKQWVQLFPLIFKHTIAQLIKP